MPIGLFSQVDITNAKLWKKRVCPHTVHLELVPDYIEFNNLLMHQTYFYMYLISEKRIL